jgi:hypothetical protein
MQFSRLRIGWLVGLVFLAGCGGRQLPSPADPEHARQALRAALDAWARGEKAQSLRGGAPPMSVVDGDWDRGLRLEKYRLEPSDRVSGPNLLCPVRLTLRTSQGRAIQKQVVYHVGTSPLVSILREEQ